VHESALHFVINTQKTLPRNLFLTLSSRLLRILLRKLKPGYLAHCHDHLQFVVGIRPSSRGLATARGKSVVRSCSKSLFGKGEGLDGFVRFLAGEPRDA
jgi:hypothetical protein